MTTSTENTASWKQLAEQAWDACEDRELTVDEKVALVAEAITIQYLEKKGYRSLDFAYLSSCSCLSVREMSAICRHHLDKVAAHLGGIALSYRKGEYEGSGRGAFGRLSGGRRAHYSKPGLVIG